MLNWILIIISSFINIRSASHITTPRSLLWPTFPVIFFSISPFSFHPRFFSVHTIFPFLLYPVLSLSFPFEPIEIQSRSYIYTHYEVAQKKGKKKTRNLFFWGCMQASLKLYTNTISTWPAIPKNGKNIRMKEEER